MLDSNSSTKTSSMDQLSTAPSPLPPSPFKRENKPTKQTGKKNKHPPSTPKPLQEDLHVGDLVDVRDYGRGTISEIPLDSSHPFFGRIQVKYFDTGSHYYCSRRRVRRVCLSESRVLLCRTTRDYRLAAIQNVERSDVCLEVGCHEGLTTALLTRRCSFAVGVDKSEAPVLAARARFPKLQDRLHIVDGFDIPALKNLAQGRSYTKIFVDIGGIAELPVVMMLVGTYFRSFPQARVIVKSVFMEKLLRSAAVFESKDNWAVKERRVVSGEGEGGWGGENEGARNQGERKEEEEMEEEGEEQKERMEEDQEALK